VYRITPISFGGPFINRNWPADTPADHLRSVEAQSGWAGAFATVNYRDKAGLFLLCFISFVERFRKTIYMYIYRCLVVVRGASARGISAAPAGRRFFQNSEHKPLDIF